MAAVPKMKESDLFEPVKSFLIKNGCSKVYGEVLGCDVFGINGVCDIVVELKTTLSFKLIDQALDRLNLMFILQYLREKGMYLDA
ncbi:hypothetical protein ABS751_10470 [Bacillus subtilis]|nr:hypothetical protein [Bacillus subtilis]